MVAPEPLTDCPTWPVSYAECDQAGMERCLTPTSRSTFEAMAVHYLWNWTARAYGLCEVTLQPCRSDCAPRPWHETGSQWMWGPVLVGGSWYNLACGWCGDLCSCATSAATALRLPGPIERITAVTIDGLLVNPATYRVDNGSLLVRQDGYGWPTCQDMALPAGQVGTWTVDYVRGIPVPEGGQVAAGVLALELAKAACGDSTCQLPRRVQSITRQGVTVALLDSFDDVAKGRTGVWLIDSWVSSVMGRPRPGTVRSVDVPSPRHRISPTVAPVNPV